MYAIAISLTLKEQDKNEILSLLEYLAYHLKGADKPVVLVHGFLPRRVVLEKGFSTSVVDALDKLFPIQLNLWDGVPLRQEMADVLERLNGDAYVIGDVKEGVAEEVNLYERKEAVNVYRVGRNGIVRLKGSNSES